MKKEIEIPPEGIIKIKKVLDTIQKRLSLNPLKQTFEFELGGFGIELKNENDYLELVDVFEGLQNKAGIKHEINTFYLDRLGRKHPITLYDSFKCKIAIIDSKKLKNFSNRILREYKSIEKTIKKEARKYTKEEKEELKNSLCRLPEGAQWEDIEIKFKNEYDIEVYYKKKFLRKSNNEEMGFYRKGTKDKNPDIQWRFLQILSTFCINKKVIKPTVENVADSLKITKDNCMKIKEKLSKKLQENFGIDEDPFYNYKDRKYYETRFKLKPEPELREDGEVFKQASGYNDGEEYNKPGKREYLNLDENN